MTLLFNFLPLLDLLDGLSEPTRERWMERFCIMTEAGVAEDKAFELIKKYMTGMEG